MVVSWLHLAVSYCFHRSKIPKEISWPALKWKQLLITSVPPHPRFSLCVCGFSDLKCLKSNAMEHWFTDYLKVKSADFSIRLTGNSCKARLRWENPGTSTFEAVAGWWCFCLLHNFLDAKPFPLSLQNSFYKETGVFPLTLIPNYFVTCFCQ